MVARHDPITWQQIGVGYVILVCIGLGTASAVVDPFGFGKANNPIHSMMTVAVFVALYVIWKLLEPALIRASSWLGPTAKGQLRLKRFSVAALWLFSLLLCAAMVRVTEIVNPW